MTKDIEFHSHLVRTKPLAIHYYFYNPEGSDEIYYVPRTLRPLGAFISLEITDDQGESVFRTLKPKLKLKLDPTWKDSYQSLEPAYTFGAILTAETADLPPGDYQVEIAYSNLVYTGFPGHDLGEMNFRETLDLHIP